MEILVSVNCVDKIIDVAISTLFKYEYFRTALSNFSSKITCEKSEYVDKSGLTRISRIYTIPSISVECSSETLLTLLNDKIIYVKPGTYDDKLLELLYYNGLYTTKVEFRNYYVKFYIIEFVKSHIPNVNVYDFLKESGWRNIKELVYHSFYKGARNELPNFLILDLID